MTKYWTNNLAICSHFGPTFFDIIPMLYTYLVYYIDILVYYTYIVLSSLAIHFVLILVIVLQILFWAMDAKISTYAGLKWLTSSATDLVGLIVVWNSQRWLVSLSCWRSFIGAKFLLNRAIGLPTHLPTYLLTHLPTYPPTYPPTYLPTYPPTHLPTYPPTQPHLYLLVFYSNLSTL